MGTLYEQLEAYKRSGVYPFHMPGHKRSMKDNGFSDPFSFDITEIDGFDNLHHAEGILREAQQRAARLFGARETFFLVNGSTAGILSAVSACVPQRGTLLMARNCHRAVYHAAFLKELKTLYLCPKTEVRYGLGGGICPEDVRRMLEQEKDVGAVVITSPTYDGIVSDVRGIARAAHEYGIPLIVDEAHGAHLRFHPYFPESAVEAGADIVIQSVHKTLPSLTQTALLHVCGPYADAEKLRRYLSIYQTSSPSYVLMASIDQCVSLLESQGPELFAAYVERLERFREKLDGLSVLRLAGEELVGNAGIYAYDRSRLVISGAQAGITGQEICRRLRRDYRIEMEMAAGDYAVGISTVMDSQEGFDRLSQALLTLDGEWKPSGMPMSEALIRGQEADKKEEMRALTNPVCVCRISEAEEAGKERIALEKAEGRISGEYVFLYPPGIPLVVPGEQIDRALLAVLRRCQAQGLELEGMQDQTGQYIQVLKKQTGDRYSG